MKDRSNFRLSLGSRTAVVPRERCFIRVKMILTLANKAYVLAPRGTFLMDDPSVRGAISPPAFNVTTGSGKQYASVQRRFIDSKSHRVVSRSSPARPSDFQQCLHCAEYA